MSLRNFTTASTQFLSPFLALRNTLDYFNTRSLLLTQETFLVRRCMGVLCVCMCVCFMSSSPLLPFLIHHATPLLILIGAYLGLMRWTGNNLDGWGGAKRVPLNDLPALGPGALSAGFSGGGGLGIVTALSTVGGNGNIPHSVLQVLQRWVSHSHPLLHTLCTRTEALRSALGGGGGGGGASPFVF